MSHPSGSTAKKTGDVTIHNAKEFHDYTVSFLAYIMWDPVHMYNAVTMAWTNFEKQITFDVRQPKIKEYSMKRTAQIYCRQSTCRRYPLHHLLPPVYPDFR